jgi:hypothetical protein
MREIGRVGLSFINANRNRSMLAGKIPFMIKPTIINNKLMFMKRTILFIMNSL